MAFPRRRFLGELPRSGRVEVLFSLFVAARKRAREPELERALQHKRKSETSLAHPARLRSVFHGPAKAGR
jgi:hypothetical protein